MDYHLLYCMLKAYRSMYIEQELKAGTSAERILHIVERDIDSHIDYFNREHLREIAERDALIERDELADTRAELKRKLHAAIVKGKAQRGE